MDSQQGNVVLLTSSNWELWKVEIRVMLMHYGAWEFVNPTDGKEEKVDQTKLSWREQQDYKLRKDRSYTVIYQSLSPEFRPLIASATDGKDAWKILCDHFEPTTRARVIQLLDDFFNTKYVHGENLGLFLCRVKRAAQRLQDVGHKLQSLYQGYQMIRCLPAEFKTTVQAIYRWKDEDFTPQKIEAELLLEENRLQISRTDVEPERTMAFCADSEKKSGNMKSISKNSNSKFKKSRLGPCHFCKAYGHLIANCRKRLNCNTESKSKNYNSKKYENSNLEISDECNVKPETKSNLNFDKSNVSEIDNVSTVYSNNILNCAFSEHEGNLTEISPEACEANLSDLGNSSWVFDTAATAHFCNNKNLYLTYEPVDDIKMSLAVGEKQCSVEGKGTVQFVIKCKNGKFNLITLKDVLYNPNLRRNLLSGTKLERLGVSFSGNKGRVIVYDKNKNFLFYATRKNDLYFLKPTDYVTASSVKDSSANVSANQVERTDTSKLWHERFCHVNNEYISETSRNKSVNGLPEISKLTEDCISCKLAKSKRISFKSIGKIRSKHPLELLHMDLCGPLPVSSHAGNRYFLSIIDDFSRKVTVYTLKNKSDVYETFLRFQKRAERFLDRRIDTIRTDGGLEFCNLEFKNFLEKQGIAHERTNCYSPEMNGVAERFNLTALDGVKALLNSSGLSQKFWAEALLCFTYTWNRVSHKSKKTPFELYSGRKPSVTHLKKFGCLAYVGVPKQKRKKLDMRAKIGIMCGYAQYTKGYRIWLVDENRIFETINVRFDENKRGVDIVKDKKKNFLFLNFPEDGDIFSYADELYGETEDKSVQLEGERSKIDVQLEGEKSKFGSSLIPCESITWMRKAVTRPDKTRTDIYYGIEGTNVRLRSFNDLDRYCKSNSIKCNKNLFDFSTKNKQSGKVSEILNLREEDDFNQEANLIEIKIPNSYKEAVKTPEASKWGEAMDQEMQVMYDREVWDLVKPPENAQVLGNRWVYTLKRNEKNEIVRHKARLVAQGFNQIKGLNYDEVFSPVVNFSIIRLFFTIFVCLFKWLNVQIDVNNAYLYAKLNETIYMQQPEGYVKKKGLVCKLRKALYGLHQSSRQWFFEMDDVLLKLKFQKLDWCNCVYIFETKLILLLYVDDIVIFGKTSEDLDFGINLLQKHFDLKIMGETKKLLGIEFEKIDDKLFIHQTTYIDKICSLYSRFQIPTSSLPIPKGLVLSKLDSPSSQQEVNEMSKFPYRNLIGCLSFIAGRTRPDIMYTVNLLSQFQSNPGPKHWNCLLKLLGYLSYTRDFKMELSKAKNLNLECYSDSDFAANRDDRVSMGGYILFLDGTPISWRTFKQRCISLSTMEAEYVTLTEAAKELSWIKNVLKNEILDLKLGECKLFCDNQAAIAFSNSPFENQRTKHIHIKYHFLRNLVYENVFDLRYIASKFNLADPFTKPQVKEQLKNFCRKIFGV